MVKQNDRIHEHTLFSVMGQKLTGHATALIIADLEADAEYYALHELGFVALSDTTLVSDTVYLESEYKGMNCRSEFKDVAATQLQRTHTPESYSAAFKPTCDGGRGRLDARHQYRRKVQPLLGAFYRGLQLFLEATAYADFRIPEITVPRFAGNRRPRANRSRRFFIRKKGVNSKQKVFPAMGSHAPGAYHLMTSFAVEQSATSMSGRANASSFNQIPSMRHQPWTLEQDHVLPPILRKLIIHTPASEFQEHLWKSRLSFARGSHCIAGLKMKSCCQSCL